MTPWARDRRRIRALQGQVQPFAMISLRERQCFHLPLQGALTWVVRVPRVPFTSPPARFILPWARFLLPLRGVHRQSCSHANENKRQQGQHLRGVHLPRRLFSSAAIRECPCANIILHFVRGIRDCPCDNIIQILNNLWNIP